MYEFLGLMILILSGLALIITLIFVGKKERYKFENYRDELLGTLKGIEKNLAVLSEKPAQREANSEQPRQPPV